MSIQTDDKKMNTTQKEIYTDGETTDGETTDGETTEEDLVTQYDQTAQEQDMDTFDENECVITHDVFMGYSEAEKLQFIMELQLCIHDDDDYVLDSTNTLLPLDLL